ncbi:MAG: hypothetical protein H7329_13425 [Opitutaceae bacterium]|nr:hypothetical protein [Cytophagales bacterium]
MEAINGIAIKRADLVEQSGKYIFFSQLEDLVKKNGHILKFQLSDHLFTKYDSLVITKEEEIVGMMGEEQIILDKVPGAFKMTQALFNE